MSNIFNLPRICPQIFYFLFLKQLTSYVLDLYTLHLRFHTQPADFESGFDWFVDEHMRDKDNMTLFFRIQQIVGGRRALCAGVHVTSMHCNVNSYIWLIIGAPQKQRRLLRCSHLENARALWPGRLERSFWRKAAVLPTSPNIWISPPLE